jgi:hypothetical protein
MKLNVTGERGRTEGDKFIVLLFLEAPGRVQFATQGEGSTQAEARQAAWNLAVAYFDRWFGDQAGA